MLNASSDIGTIGVFNEAQAIEHRRVKEKPHDVIELKSMARWCAAVCARLGADGSTRSFVRYGNANPESPGHCDDEEQEQQ